MVTSHKCVSGLVLSHYGSAWNYLDVSLGLCNASLNVNVCVCVRTCVHAADTPCTVTLECGVLILLVLSLWSVRC